MVGLAKGYKTEEEKLKDIIVEQAYTIMILKEKLKDNSNIIYKMSAKEADNILKIKDEVIDINITDKNNKKHKIKFPLLEKNKLKEGDYFDEDGIHHIIE